MKIGLSMRVTDAVGYAEPRDSISHDWLQCLRAWGMTPLLIPNLLPDPAAYFDAVAPDFLILTGGDDLGATPVRDATETILLKHAMARQTPVLGVCRGMQLINTHFGGVSTMITGHVGSAHPVDIANGWAACYGARTTVNSFHTLGIAPDNVGPGLDIMAVDPEGYVEGVRHVDLPLAAIMWHPERAGAPAGDRFLFDQLAGRA